MKEYLSLTETSEYIGKSKETLRRWDREGKLLAVREPMSNYRVYRKSDIDNLFADFVDSDFENSDINFVEPNDNYTVLELLQEQEV
jgi:DNA (cytosine-5)-methyltransferase 1